MNAQRDSRRRGFPELAYNPITLIGICLALFGCAAFLILYITGLLSKNQNPYQGIFIFIVAPGVLILGLLIIPLGMLLEKRRYDRGEHRPFIVDFSIPGHRNAALVFGVGSAVFLLLTTLGLFETYQYSESVTFCGQVCHLPMTPEYTAFQASPHARVPCVQCHVGAGTEGYLNSKLAGARQLYHFALGDFHRPIPTPIYNLRPARETCEECHWPDRDYAPRVNVYDHYLGDAANTHWQVTMLFNVGGATPGRNTSGLHWHTSEANRMSYVSADSSRQSFVSVTWNNGGKPVTYTLDGAPLDAGALEDKRKKGLERSMDCMDCHNRPAHRYLSPMEAVNRSLQAGRLDTSIPWIKREAVRVLSRPYETSEAARRAIADSLTAAYRVRGLQIAPTAVRTVQELYAENFFPEMKVRWEAYPENQGHLFYPGCFRCHGSSLQTADGRKIGADCNLCHTVVRQGLVDPAALTQAATGAAAISMGERFRHPIDVDASETVMRCTDCHIGDASVYKAAAATQPNLAPWIGTRPVTPNRR